MGDSIQCQIILVRSWIDFIGSRPSTPPSVMEFILTILTNHTQIWLPQSLGKHSEITEHPYRKHTFFPRNWLPMPSQGWHCHSQVRGSHCLSLWCNGKARSLSVEPVLFLMQFHNYLQIENLENVCYMVDEKWAVSFDAYACMDWKLKLVDVELHIFRPHPNRQVLPISE